MKFNKLFSTILATLMLSPIAVMAADPSITPGVANEIDEGSSTTTMPLTGEIVITKLNVTVPSNIHFQLDPSVGTDLASSIRQVLAPANIKITNNSVCPIVVKVSKVESTGISDFVDQSTGLSTDKTIMFALKDTDTSLNVNSGSDATLQKQWLNPGVGGAIDDPYYITTGTGVNGKIEVDADQNVYIHALTKKGWKKGETFTITPYLTISAAT